MKNRAIHAAMLATLAAISVSGCTRLEPDLEIENASGEPIAFRIEFQGGRPVEEFTLDPGHGVLLEMERDTCEPARTVASTPERRMRAVLDEPLCGFWFLMVDDDFTLHYYKSEIDKPHLTIPLTEKGVD